MFQQNNRYEDQFAGSSFKCGHCNTCFESEKSLNIHNILFHENIKFLKCEICNEHFSDDKNLLSHIKSTHSKPKPYKCINCIKSFETITEMMVHIKVHEDPTMDHKSENEPLEKLSTKNKNALSQNNESKFEGDQSSAPKQNLIRHEKVHKNVEFESKIETDETKSKSIITTVMDNAFRCEICSKTFTTKYYINHHKDKVHGKMTPYLHKEKNEIIQKYLTAKQNYENLTLKNFVSELSKEGKDIPKSILTNWLQEKAINPFKCKLCPKSYRVNGHLKEHIILVHEDKRPFKCDLCNTTCKLKKILTRHKKLSHGI